MKDLEHRQAERKKLELGKDRKNGYKCRYPQEVKVISLDILVQHKVDIKGLVGKCK